MTSKKARRIRLFQDLQKNSPPKRKAYFVLKFVPLDILPDFIIPYSGYGLFFLLRVLAEYFLRFSITLSQLRPWLQFFREQKEEWLGALSSMKTSGLSFLKAFLT